MTSKIYWGLSIIEKLLNTVTHIKDVVHTTQLSGSVNTVSVGKAVMIQDALDDIRKRILNYTPSSWPNLSTKSDLDGWSKVAMDAYNEVHKDIISPFTRACSVIQLYDPKTAWRMSENTSVLHMNVDWNSIRAKAETDPTLKTYLQFFDDITSKLNDYFTTGTSWAQQYSYGTLYETTFGVNRCGILINNLFVLASELNTIAMDRPICPYGKLAPVTSIGMQIPTEELQLMVNTPYALTHMFSQHSNIAWVGELVILSGNEKPLDYILDMDTYFNGIADKTARSWQVLFYDNNGELYILPSYYNYRLNIQIGVGDNPANDAALTNTVTMWLWVYCWHGTDGVYYVDEKKKFKVQKTAHGLQGHYWSFEFVLPAKSDKWMFFLQRYEAPNSYEIGGQSFSFTTGKVRLDVVPNGETVDYGAIYYYQNDVKQHLSDPHTTFVSLLGKCQIWPDDEENFNVVTLWSQLVGSQDRIFNDFIAILVGYCYTGFEKIDVNAQLIQYFGAEFDVSKLMPIQHWIYEKSIFAECTSPSKAILALSGIVSTVARWAATDPDFAEYILSVLDAGGHIVGKEQYKSQPLPSSKRWLYDDYQKKIKKPKVSIVDYSEKKSASITTQGSVSKGKLFI